MHKHLITELLKGGETYFRFQQKQAQYEAALDCEEDGGVDLSDALCDDEEIENIQFEAIKPDTPPDTPFYPASVEPYPPLPSQTRSVSLTQSKLASTLGDMSVDGDSKTSTVVNSPATTICPAGSFRSDSIHKVLSTQDSTAATGSRQPKVWGSREGMTTSNVLFPGAKSTPVPSEFSIEAHDNRMEQEHGFNIMRTRFWDPKSNDFNADRFYDVTLNKYYCPFVCE